MSTNELKIIQRLYDLIKWYVPILNRLPKDHKFILGNKTIHRLYEILEDLITAQFSPQKLDKLQSINTKLAILRYQTRLLHDFELISTDRYEYVSRSLQEIGKDLGAWIKKQKQKENHETPR